TFDRPERQRASEPPASSRFLTVRQVNLRPVIKDRTAIVGVGQTAFAKHLDGSEKRLACQAIVAALDDAGIDPSEVDAFSSYTMENTEEVEIAKNIGAGDVTFFSQIGYGGGAGC